MSCANRYKKGSGLGFFRFPCNSKHREAWMKAISRAKWSPAPYDRLCGHHFVERNRPTILKTSTMFLQYLRIRKDRDTPRERGEGNEWNAWSIANDGGFKTKQLLHWLIAAPPPVSVTLPTTNPLMRTSFSLTRIQCLFRGWKLVCCCSIRACMF